MVRKTYLWVMMVLLFVFNIHALAQDTTGLTVTTTAIGVTNRTLNFEWSVAKSSDTASLQLAPDESGDLTFAINATRSNGPTTEVYAVSGEVCITNTGTMPTQDLAITDTLLIDGIPAFTTEVDPGAQIIINPGITICYAYQHSFQFDNALTSTITNQATATITNGDQPNYTSPPVTVDLSPVNLTPLDESVTVNDTINCPEGFTCSPSSLGPLQLFGTTTLPFTTTITNDNADCNLTHSLLNTVSTLESDSGLNRQANAALTLTCEADSTGGTIIALKYLDADSDGEQDSGELLLAGWTIEVLDEETNNVVTTTETDSSGTATFSDLPPGAYTVCETLTDGWINPSGDLCTEVSVSAGEITQVAFGNRQPVIPIAECTITHDDGTDTAYFGYNNPNPVPITLPVGPQNQFTPLPADRGQPTNLQPGRSALWPNTPLAVPALTSDAAWSLDGTTAPALPTPCARRIQLEKVWLNADATETDPPFDLGLDELTVTASSTLGTATCGYEAQAWVCIYANVPAAPDNMGLWVIAGETYAVNETGTPDLWQPVEDSVGTGFVPASICADNTSNCIHTVQNAQMIPTSPPGASFTPR